MLINAASAILAPFFYYRARWYDPQAKRFLNENPIGLAGGINLYAYVGNNPINAVDPNGLATVYVWPSDKDHFGHAALELDDGTYISFWPTGMNAALSSEAFLSKNLDQDTRGEGNRDPIKVRLDNLDEDAIKQWWSKFRSNLKDHDFNFLWRNCSTIVSEALGAGGGRKRAPGNHHIVWEPADVLKYAQEIDAAGDNDNTPVRPNLQLRMGPDGPYRELPPNLLPPLGVVINPGGM
jgi:uncharacterized protein RhaS with RHS repeats